MTVRRLVGTLGLLLVLPLLAGMLLPAPSEASVILVTSRAALGGDDFIDWGQLGVPHDLVPNPSAIVSNGGITGTVGRENQGDLQRRNENPPGSGGWNGNFAAGDRLIWTNNLAGAMLIDLNSSVAGLGAQIQLDRLAGLFDATIEVYDVLNNLLASFTIQGDSNANRDNSAIFIGVLSDSRNIDHIVLFTNDRTRSQDDFAINQLDIVSTVPGPAALVMVGLGLLALGVAGRARRD